MYTKKNVIEIKNEIKCNFLGRNDGDDFKNRFLDLRMKSDFRVFGSELQEKIHCYVMELIPCLVVCFSEIIKVL